MAAAQLAGEDFLTGMDRQRADAAGRQIIRCMAELPNPVNFPAAVASTGPGEVREQSACGPAAKRHLQVASSTQTGASTTWTSSPRTRPAAAGAHLSSPGPGNGSPA
jgi:hypothetical protein